jgi:hypothetical protein
MKSEEVKDKLLKDVTTEKVIREFSKTFTVDEEKLTESLRSLLDKADKEMFVKFPRYATLLLSQEGMKIFTIDKYTAIISRSKFDNTFNVMAKDIAILGDKEKSSNPEKIEKLLEFNTEFGSCQLCIPSEEEALRAIGGLIKDIKRLEGMQ